MVLVRGKLPAPFVFLGEAPGRSEDLTGYPFVGEAGELLEDIVAEVRKKVGDFRYAVTNVVGCIPVETTETGTGIRVPEPVEAYACSPRLKELYAMARPRVVFLLGQTAAKYYKYPDPVALPVALTHPAAILRMPDTKAALAIRRMVVRIAETVTRFSKTKEKE